MRTLTFGPDDKEKYDLIYEAFAVTERPFKGADLRIAAKIFDKLESLGAYSTSRGNINMHVFKAPGEIKFEEAEFSVLKESLQAVTWNAAGARKAAPVLDWIDGIKEDSAKLKVEK